MRGIQEGPELNTPDVIGKMILGGALSLIVACGAMAAPVNVRHPANMPVFHGPGDKHETVIYVPNVPQAPVTNGVHDGPDTVDPTGAWDNKMERIIALVVGCNGRQTMVCQAACASQFKPFIACYQSNDGYGLFCRCEDNPYMDPACRMCSDNAL